MLVNVASAVYTGTQRTFVVADLGTDADSTDMLDQQFGGREPLTRLVRAG